MNLIKINHTYINLDNVCDIGTNDDEVHIYFNTPRGWGADGESKIEQEYRTFLGTEAAALRAWLELRASNVMAEYEQDQKREQYFAAANARVCPNCGGDGCAACISGGILA